MNTNFIINLKAIMETIISNTRRDIKGKIAVYRPM